MIFYKWLLFGLILYQIQVLNAHPNFWILRSCDIVIIIICNISLIMFEVTYYYYYHIYISMKHNNM